jgi:hypothetical protein
MILQQLQFRDTGFGPHVIQVACHTLVYERFTQSGADGSFIPSAEEFFPFLGISHNHSPGIFVKTTPETLAISFDSTHR